VGLPGPGRGGPLPLDVLLREVAANGAWVSAHPDVILTLGTKEVLHRTRDLGWGTDTDLYRDTADFRARFPKGPGQRHRPRPEAGEGQQRERGLEGRAPRAGPRRSLATAAEHDPHGKRISG